MSRSISQIYSEAVATRNNYLQISPLNSGRSESKLSVINVMTYVMAVLIHSYEVLFDLFQIQIAQLIAERVSGTPAYYAKMAYYFQYNPDTEAMDELIYDDNSFQIKFKNYDESHKIIAKSAYQNDDDKLVLKVCKKNSDSNNNNGGSIYSQLTANELTAFKNYIDEIKFVGVKIYCRSTLGDILSVNATIVYDDLYINEEQALNNIKTALIQYIQELDFNGYVYYQSVINAIKNAEHIISISGPNPNSEEDKYAKVTISEYDEVSKAYKVPVTIVERYLSNSGYLTFLDETSSNKTSTLIADDTHFIFKANSSVQWQSMFIDTQ